MPLYVSMRRAVRAMTAASHGASQEAARGLTAAIEVLRRVAEPRLIAIGGISGSGKSTLARSLAPRVAPLAGAVIIRSDVVRKRLSGVPPEKRLPEAAYASRMDGKVLARMAFDARAALRAGCPVVLDATFLDAEARVCAAEIARAAGVRFDGIWLELPAEEAMKRVEGRTADASDATAAVVERQASRGARPSDWRMLQAGRPLEVVLRDVEGLLAARR
jgi:predicted kinase